jgi:hypothetical protein
LIPAVWSKIGKNSANVVVSLRETIPLVERADDFGITVATKFRSIQPITVR